MDRLGLRQGRLRRRARSAAGSRPRWRPRRPSGSASSSLVAPVGVKTGPGRQARHSRHLRHAAGEREPAAVPRSGEVAVRSVEVQRRGTHHHRAQPRDPGAAGVGAVDAQSQAQASAAPHRHARPCSCAARATGSSRPTISRAMRKLVPNARIETIAAAGHALQIEQPEAFAAQALGFPRRLIRIPKEETAPCRPGISPRRPIPTCRPPTVRIDPRQSAEPQLRSARRARRSMTATSRNGRSPRRKASRSCSTSIIRRRPASIRRRP